MQLCSQATESMRLAAFPRTLHGCDWRPLAAGRGPVCRLARRTRPLAATETYQSTKAYRAENGPPNTKSASQWSTKRQFSPNSAYDHPLSIEALQNLPLHVPHIFTSRSSSPYFNLAVEHHLLTYSHPSSRILFTYSNVPCAIIGRNQNPWVECDVAAIARGTTDGRVIQLIRRRSGGGTVFHDEGNLNYSIIVPGEGFERKTHVQMVVDALAKLRDLQSDTRRWERVRANKRNDIVATLKEKFWAEDAGNGEEEWLKVSGTAFKLTKGRALHHGTLLHSSPYIDSIGTFLRSPGRNWITAKGVESVRSPVMNLWDAKNPKQRRDLLDAIRKSIHEEWLKMNAFNPTGQILALEVASGEVESLLSEVRAGVEELRSVAWKWDQTPGFSFRSKGIETSEATPLLTFEVKHGLIQCVKTSRDLQASYEQALLQKNIRDMSAPGAWRKALKSGHSSSDQAEEMLIKLVETCFPPIDPQESSRGASQMKTSDQEPSTPVESRKMNVGVIKRTDGDGSVEIEKEGSNTVVQAQPSTRH